MAIKDLPTSQDLVPVCAPFILPPQSFPCPPGCWRQCPLTLRPTHHHRSFHILLLAPFSKFWKKRGPEEAPRLTSPCRRGGSGERGLTRLLEGRMECSNAHVASLSSVFLPPPPHLSHIRRRVDVSSRVSCLVLCLSSQPPSPP